jgi:glycosyltransferase involved in cell wall biosynthesis
MMRRRRISVLIPAYNHSAYIAEAIASVLAQDWPDLELRVLDDGSSDDTLAQAERAVQGQTRVRCVLAKQENAGVSASLNRLMAEADGDIVAILNSDDRFAPGRLPRMMEWVGDARRFFAFSRVNFVGGPDAPDFEALTEWYDEALAKASGLPTAGFALMIANVSISSSNFVFSRDLIERTGGFDPVLPLTQDWDFALRCLGTVEPVFVPDALLDYRVHPSNTWRNHQDTRIEQSAAVLHGYFSRLHQADNPLAPGLGGWPRFLPIFVAVARPVFAQTSLAGVLDEMALETVSARLAGAPGDRVERTAIVNLIAAARANEARPAGLEAFYEAAARWQSLAASIALPVAA